LAYKHEPLPDGGNRVIAIRLNVIQPFILVCVYMPTRGGNATLPLNIFSIFYTHHRIPDKHMMTINFDTITNNYEVIYVIKTVMNLKYNFI
jgi:hypothetical protein